MGTRSRGISMPGAGHGEHPWKATYGAWPLAHPFRDTETNLCSNTPRDPEGVGGLRWTSNRYPLPMGPGLPRLVAPPLSAEARDLSTSALGIFISALSRRVSALSGAATKRGKKYCSF